MITMTTADDQAWETAMQCRTLLDAHQALASLRPSHEVSTVEWQRFHERSAMVYTAVANVDRGHHHEALYWADACRGLAAAEDTSNGGDTDVR